MDNKRFIFRSYFSDYFNEYIEFRQAISKSANSAKENFANLDRYILENWPDETTLSEDLVLGWLTRRPNESGRTLNGRASFIRVFASYLVETGRDAYVVPKDFCTSGIRYTPYLFTDQELGTLFRVIDTDTNVDQFVGCILSTVLRLIYTCGLRPSEGLRVLRNNVNLTTGEILLVKTKGHKERIVVMSDDMLRLMKRYISIRDVAFPDSDYLFPDPYGEPYPAQWLSDRFRKYFRSLHPGVELSEMPCARVYDLRHRFASQCLVNWLGNGVDLNTRLPYLSTYMGHGSINETAYYIHILPENLLSSETIDFNAMEAIIPEVAYER